MHARIDQLLSLRDGEPVDSQAAFHIGQCSACAAELHRLSTLRKRMQELPSFDAPTWDRVHERMRTGSGRAARRVVIAVAAGVAVLSIATALLLVSGGAQQSAETAGVEIVEPASPRPVTGVEELVTQSRRLEEMLRVLPARPVVERVSTAATIDTLEQRIQWLDLHLSYAPDAGLSERQAERLWRERVELMDSLVKVRYAESGYMSF
jgi:hypothetical protein